MKIQNIVANLVGNTRFDTMEGRQYLVAPMVMMTEGVHNGSGGPILYKKDELSKTPEVWNHKPVVVYHPSANGQGVSACDPIILSNRKVGIVMNTKLSEVEVNNKKVPCWKAEAWLEQDRINKVDERISDFLNNKEMMELSTGLFVDPIDEDGDWNGEHYDQIATNLRPDHLALLPDLKGACSIEDGAGLLRNQIILNAVPEKIKIVNNKLSHDNIRSMINSWLREKNPTDNWELWVADVYDDFFIYENRSKLTKLDYEIKDNSVVINGMEEEVIRVTEYRTKTGEFVGNKRKESIMDKKKVVDTIIASNGNSFVEDNRDALMSMDEDVLEKLQADDKAAAELAVENAALKVEKEKPEVTKEPEVTKKPEVTDNADEKPQTIEDHIASLPAEVQPVMTNAINQYNQTKKRLVAKIMENENNQFTEDQLKAKNNDELSAIVSIAFNKSEGEKVMNYAGQGIDNSTVVENTEEPLVMPPTFVSKQ